MNFIRNKVVFGTVFFTGLIISSELCWAGQSLSVSDYAKINLATAKFESLQKIALALSNACKFSSTQDGQALCLQEGDKWILDNLLSPGKRIPCTVTQTEFDTKGMLLRACTNAFRGKDDNDQAYDDQVRCLFSPYFAQIKAQSWSRDWIFFGLTKSQDTLQVPSCSGNVPLSLTEGGNSFLVDLGSYGPGYSTTRAYEASCISSEIASERALLVKQESIDKLNPGIQGLPNTVACENSQNR